MTEFFEIISACMGKRSLKGFNSAAAAKTRAYFNAAATRSEMFDTGVMSCALEVLGVRHGCPAIRPAFTTGTEVAALLSERCALSAAVKAEEAEKRAEANARAASKKGTYWAAGTGYGHGSVDDGDWDDDGNFTAPKSTGGITSPAAKEAENRLMTETDVFLQVLIVLLEPTSSGDALPESTFHVLAASPYIPVLRALVRQSMYLSEKYPSLFKNLVRAVRVLAVQPALAPLLSALPGDTDSSSLAAVMADFASVMVLDEEDMGADAALTAPVKDKLKSTIAMLSTASPSKPTAPVAAASSDAALVVNHDAVYAAAMKTHQFGSIAMEAPAADGSGAKYRHHYASTLSAETGTAPQRAPRVMRELRGLRSSLPLTAGSSVFLRHDKKRPHVLQVMISGPEDTPYDAGLFLFDVYCPPEYPSVSPKVNLMTTGGGTVRFNPNLYNCGKVCLSLLGTWSGAAGESWTSESTLLQVFVSIQALIFVKEPYFNEPGVESYMGTEGAAESSRHSSNGGYERLRLHNIKFAMIDMIKRPPAGFESVVASHFALRKEHILATAQAWLDDATKSKAELEPVVKELREVLEALPPIAPAPTAVCGGAGGDVVDGRDVKPACGAGEPVLPSLPVASQALKREDSA